MSTTSGATLLHAPAPTAGTSKLQQHMQPHPSGQLPSSHAQRAASDSGSRTTSTPAVCTAGNVQHATPRLFPSSQGHLYLPQHAPPRAAAPLHADRLRDSRAVTTPAAVQSSRRPLHLLTAGNPRQAVGKREGGEGRKKGRRRSHASPPPPSPPPSSLPAGIIHSGHTSNKETTASQVIYDVAARPVVKVAMEGINGTVFAYGVTNSGKTHTMHGDQNSPGIIPLAIKDVFSIIQDTPGENFYSGSHTLKFIMRL